MMEERTRISISGDGQYVALGSGRFLHVFSINPHELRYAKEFVNYKISNLAVSFDGAQVGIVCSPIVGCGKHKICVWDTFFGEAEHEIETNENVRGLALHLDYLIVVLQETFILYSIESRSIIMEQLTAPNPNGTVSISSGIEPSVAVCGLVPGGIQIIHPLGKFLPIFIEAHNHPISRVVISQDGSLVATASDQGTLIRLFDASTGSLLTEFRRGKLKSRILAMAISPNNTKLAILSENGTIHLFAADYRTDAETNPLCAMSKMSLQVGLEVSMAFKTSSELVVVSSSGFVEILTIFQGKTLHCSKHFLIYLSN